MIPVTQVFPSLMNSKDKYIITICICSISERAGMLAALLHNLENQCKKLPLGSVQILVSLDDRGQNTTGAKRNALVFAALGDLVNFVDDDDEISGDYVQQILIAAEGNPDTISINGTMTQDGRPHATWEISRHHRNFTMRKAGRIHYIRYTNHLSPVRRSIAIQCPFPDTYWEEDSAYSKALMNSKLIRIETKVFDPIYHYKYQTKK